MRRAFVFLLFLLTFLSCRYQGEEPSIENIQEKDQKNLVQKIENASIGLLTYKDKEKQYQVFCGGTWISENQIITAKHCVVDNDKDVTQLQQLDINDPEFGIKLQFILNDLLRPDEKKFVGKTLSYFTFKEKDKDFSLDKLPNTATIVKISVAADLALLEIADPPNHEIAPISPSPFLGQQIHIIGHPGREEFTYFPGYISSIRRSLDQQEIGTTELLQISAPIYFGNSGGGLFNSKGELLGVCTFLKANIPNIGYFISSSELKKFLDSSE
jgi:hypothetical protein